MACLAVAEAEARESASRLIVERYRSHKRGTLSRVWLEGPDGARRRLCDGLEPPWRNNEKNVSCIPVGTYPLRLRNWGDWYQKAIKHKRLGSLSEPGMIEVCKVPGRSAILIHWGNFPEHTEGCLLVGNADPDNKVAVWSSVATYERFYSLIVPMIEAGTLKEIVYRDLAS